LALFWYIYLSETFSWPNTSQVNKPSLAKTWEYLIWSVAGECNNVCEIFWFRTNDLDHLAPETNESGVLRVQFNRNSNSPIIPLKGTASIIPRNVYKQNDNCCGPFASSGGKPPIRWARFGDVVLIRTENDKCWTFSPG
jgi:hypothetical protein